MTSGHDIAMGLRAAYLAMHRQTEAALSASHVTADQFVVLSLLAERDAITQQELVRRASSDPNTMRSMLVLLEQHGLVRRRQHPTDGRARLVTLTPEGRGAFDRLWAAVGRLQGELLSLFELQEADQLAELLGRISGALAQPTKRRAEVVEQESADEEESDD